MMERIDYVATVILFCIGLYAMVVKTNLIKKLIGLNIMETSVYLFFIALGDIRLGESTGLWAKSPIADDPSGVSAGTYVMVNPIPHALILTAIVVSICVTALALSVAIKLYGHYGTLDTTKMASLKG